MWYKNAVIYNLDVETFMDSNGDGIGDFPGLTQRIDHLENLGVDCVWLQPFHPTPNLDDGYDITDYYAVDSRLGSLGDFADFSSELRQRGIRLIIDLVVNHTSDQHPWFQAGAAIRSIALPRLLHLVGRAARRPRQGHRLPRRAEDHLDLEPQRPAPTTSTASTSTSPTSTSPTPPCAPRS